MKRAFESNHLLFLALGAALSFGCTAQIMASPANRGGPPQSTTPSTPEEANKDVGGSAKSGPSATPEKAAQSGRLTPCKAEARVETLMDVLLGAGNQWTYTYFEGWFTTLRDWGEKTFVVERKKTVGAYTVAEVTAQYTSRVNPKLAQKTTLYRIAKGSQLCEVEWGRQKPAWASTTASWAQKAFDDAYTCWDLAKMSTAPTVKCLGVICGPVKVTETKSGERGARFWPPVGMVSAFSAEYSPQTGDGTGTSLVLTGYRLAKSMPVAPVKVSDSPASFQAFKKTLATVRTAGMKAVSAHVAKDVTYSINPEHRTKELALAGWAKDGGRGATTLAQLAEGPCGQISAGGAAYVVCPRRLAEEYAAAATACENAADPTVPRAVFQERGGQWRLTSLFLGGADDLYAASESDDAPARPWSQYSKAP